MKVHFKGRNAKSPRGWLFPLPRGEQQGEGRRLLSAVKRSRERRLGRFHAVFGLLGLSGAACWRPASAFTFKQLLKRRSNADSAQSGALGVSAGLGVEGNGVTG